MSHEAYVTVGPFAEWLVPESADPGFPEDAQGFRQYEGVFGRHWGGFHDNVVLVGGVPHRHYRLTPLETRPNGPQFGSQCYSETCGDWGPHDYSAVDPKAEMTAFTTAFGPELSELTRWFGEPPTIRWGVIKSDTC